MVSVEGLRRAHSVLGLRGLSTAMRQRVTWRRSSEDFVDRFVQGARVLEIGGPSAVFREGGLVPVYAHAASVDNVNYAGETIWETALAEGGDYAPSGVRLGTQHLREATDLKLAGGYDLVASSHTIEHTANPLKALRGWRKLTRPGGHLLMVLPHRDGTVDHRRPVTKLEHLLEDERVDMPETDMTHARESIELSDWALDGFTKEQWAERVRDNVRRRSLHHHVFTTRSAVVMVAEAGWTPVMARAFWPYDIVILASNGGEAGPLCVVSPFRSDRPR